MKRYISLLAIALIFSVNAFAQTYVDALRFSQQDYEGTARFTSMGGAFGALGGDFTSLSLNPAGIGVYRSSEITFTPSLTFNKVSSDYMNSSASDNRTRLGFSNMGYVGTYLTGREEGLVSFNFGVGYTKTMSYNRNATMQGNNSPSSMMDYFADKASANRYDVNKLEANDPYQYFGFDHWDAVLAYNVGLYDPIKNNGVPTGEFESALYGGDKVNQYRHSSQTGSNGEYVFSLGGNISNKFYFGATLGVQDISYESTVIYREAAASGNKPGFNNYVSREYIDASGTGYNGKFGVIYRPVPQLRIGASVHTPTYFYLSDSYYAEMDSSLGGENFGFETPYNEYDYRINSPMRAMGSLAYTFGNIGLLSVDYEYIGYSGMKLKSRYSDPFEFEGENQKIKNYIQSTSNIRVGGEAWINNFALRAGFIYNQSPDKDFDMKKLTYSAGFGYKYGSFFLDVAYAFSTSKNYPILYYNPIDDIDMISTETDKRNRFMVTVGFKF